MSIVYKERGRIFWIDYVKGIAITLMVFGHLPMANSSYNDYVYCFHMPVFFLVSGFFAKKSGVSFSSLLKKNSKQLLIPYTLLYLITIPLGLITIYSHPSLFGNPSTMDLFWKPLVGLLLGEYVSFTKISICTNGPLWFLIALFWVRLIAFLLSRKGVLFGLLMSLAASFLLWLFEDKLCNFNVYWSLDSAIYACPFYLIGSCMSKNKILIQLNKVPKILSVFISLVLFVVVVVVYKINGRIDVCAMNVGHSFLLSYVNALFGSFALIFMCKAIPSCNLLAKIGQSSMVILAFNGFSLYCIRFVLNKVFDIDYTGYSLLCGVIISIVVVVSLVPLYIFISKHYPCLVGR